MQIPGEGSIRVDGLGKSWNGRIRGSGDGNGGPKSVHSWTASCPIRCASGIQHVTRWQQTPSQSEQQQLAAASHWHRRPCRRLRCRIRLRAACHQVLCRGRGLSRGRLRPASGRRGRRRGCGWRGRGGRRRRGRRGPGRRGAGRRRRGARRWWRGRWGVANATIVVREDDAERGLDLGSVSRVAAEGDHNGGLRVDCHLHQSTVERGTT